MKAKHEPDPSAALPNAALKPDASDLATALGRAAAPLVGVLATLRANRPAVTTEWQFSERSGWYQLWMLKKRRLLYLIPKQGDVRVLMILGGKAIAQLKAGPFAHQTNALLKSAKHYPEGTMFSFDRKSLDADLLTAFLAAKLAY